MSYKIMFVKGLIHSLRAFIFIERSNRRQKLFCSKIGILSENNIGVKSAGREKGPVADSPIRGQQSHVNPTNGTGGRLMLKEEIFLCLTVSLGPSALPKDRATFLPKFTVPFK